MLLAKLGVRSCVDRMPPDQRQFVMHQVHLPTSLGGLGAPDITQHYHSAYIASLAYTAEHDLSLRMFATYSGERPTTTSAAIPASLHEQLQASLDAIYQSILQLKQPFQVQRAATTVCLAIPRHAKRFFHSLLYGAFTTAVAGPDIDSATTGVAQGELETGTAIGLERLLRKQYNKALKQRLQTLAEAQGRWQRARMLSCANAGASWLAATWTTLATTLSNAVVQTAVCLRLGLPPWDVMPANCLLCNRGFADDGTPLLLLDQ